MKKNKTNSSTITFNANGGDGENYTQTFEENKEQSILENRFTHPIKRKVFGGWMLENNSTKADYSDKENIKITKNLNLYALWLDTDLAPAGKIGKYNTPMKIGDVVFSDGSVSEYTEDFTDYQKSQAIAIIYKSENEAIMGIGTNYK